MAVGKNKRISKGSKKRKQKESVDPFSKKDWYDVKAPSTFTVRTIRKTLVTRTQGTKVKIIASFEIASDGLKHRMFEIHGDYSEHVGVKGDRPAEEAPR